MPRLLFASYHCYIDPASGAAIATRDLLEMMAGRGWACRLVCGPVLDVCSVRRSVELLEPRMVLSSVPGGVPDAGSTPTGICRAAIERDDHVPADIEVVTPDMIPECNLVMPPFPRTQVPPAEEESPGVGIRRNGDHDNGNQNVEDWDVTSIAEENDLIEVSLVGPGAQNGLTWELHRTNRAISVWSNQNKSGPVLAGSTDTVTLPNGCPEQDHECTYGLSAQTRNSQRRSCGPA